jgi:Pyruvate/2-oxoacid:ferredoxin oxidoreductase delta subunit
VPIEGDTFDLKFTTLIAAISQEPEFAGFENLIEGRDWIKVDGKFKTKEDGLYAGGDNINLGIAIDAIYHGRQAASAIHEQITGEAMVAKAPVDIVRLDKMNHSWYEAKERTGKTDMAVAERLKSLTAEITRTWTREEAIGESKRCMSCGLCFDCGTCWSFCQDSAIIKPMDRGGQYKVKMEFCNGCKKCAENCPCGYIEMH